MIGDVILISSKDKKRAIKLLPKILKLKDRSIIAIQGSAGTKKCLGKGTKVLMYDGSLKKVENIKIGDLIMSPNSNSIKVIKITSGIDKLYKIKQINGKDYIVNQYHVLSLLRSNKTTKELTKINGKRRRKNIKLDDTVENISVNDYIKKYSNSSNPRVKGYKTDIQFKHQKVPLDPYFLGLWLGDGRNNGDSICNPDIEIIDWLKWYAKKLDMKISKYQYKQYECPSWAITNGKGNSNKGNYIKNSLKRLNLLFNKHLPNIYKINSKENRLQLLAGLIDSDGCLNRGGYTITTKYLKLAKDIIFLSRSLGFRVSRSIYKVKEYPDNKYYTIFIYGFVNQIPCKVVRKIASPRRINKNPLKTGITVKYIGIGKYYGFELEGKDKRFVLDDFTVTHNSELGKCIQDELYKIRKRSLLLCIDDYYKSHFTVRDRVRKRNGIQSVGLKEIDWKFLKNIIKDFKKQKQELSVQYINKYTDSFFDVKIIEADKLDYIIIEGLYSGWLKKWNLIDYVIHLDGNPEQTKAFRKKRKKENESSRFRDKIVKKEFNVVSQLKRYADIVIDWEGDTVEK